MTIMFLDTSIQKVIFMESIPDSKGGSRHEDSNTMKITMSYKKHFSDYFTLHRGDIATCATPLDPVSYTHLTLPTKA